MLTTSTRVEDHPLYGVWRQMRMRCALPTHHKYPRYGGRGIKVCDRWQTFANFVEDMGERPSGGTLGRIDNDGGYEPGNVRWESSSQQQRNTSRTRLLTFGEKTQSMADWADEIGISYDVLNHRINAYGWTVERALKEPVRC